jgi:hypothetical protein
MPHDGVAENIGSLNEDPSENVGLWAEVTRHFFPGFANESFGAWQE